jgi:hypothetical protein
MRPPYNQGSQFEPIRAYDAPGVLASRAIDGDLGFQSIRNALISPERLTPSERESFSSRLRRGYGGDPFSDTLIGMATNPFVWMMFLTSAPGAVSLRAGKRIFTTTPKLSAFVREKGGFLQPLKMLTGMQAVRGTHLVEGLNDFSQALNKLREDRISFLSEVQTRVLKALGVSSLDYDHLKGLPKEKVQRIMAAVAARLGGFDHDRVVNTQTLVPRYFKKTWDQNAGKHTVAEVLGETDTVRAARYQDLKKERQRWYEETAELKRRAGLGELSEGEIQLLQARIQRGPGFELFTKHDTVSRQSYVQHALGSVEETDRILAEVPGLKELVEAYQKQAGATWAMMTKGADGTYDVNKLYNLARGIANKDFENNIDSLFGELGRGHQGKDLIEAMLSEDNLAALRLKEVTPQEFGEKLVRALTGSVDEKFYFPLNTIEEVTLPGRKVLDRSVVRAQMEGTMLGTSARMIGKTAKSPMEMLHPKDLDAFEMAYGNTPGIHAARTATMKRAEYLATEAGGNQAAGAYRLNVTKAMDRYFKEAEETIALHSQAPSRAVVEAQKETLKLARPPGSEDAPLFPMSLKGTLGGRASYTSAFDEVVIWEIPGFARSWEEGFTRADAIHQGLRLIPDEHVRRQIQQSVLPAITGRKGVEALGLVGAMWNMKKGLQSFVDSGMGRWFEGQGEWGPRMMARFREMADPAADLPSGMGFSGMVARWLYTTHLGLNLGSVTLNLTQPFLLTAPVLGIRATMEGYGKAIGEMWSYLKDRVGKHGVGPISQTQRRNLIQKHFRFGEESDIGADFLRTLDSTVFGGRIKGSGGTVGRIEEYMMKLFEKSEWLNRTTTAHAVDAAYRASGRVLDERGLREVSRFVGETQFGANALNTPELLLNTPFFSNPAIKQFLTFPLRSFTAVAHTMPGVGGQEYSRGLLNVAVRGMGVSALVYEAGKNLLGADLSRGLFLEATTDFVGGERLIEDSGEWIKVPPALDIPRDFLVGMATGDRDLLRDSLARSFPGGVSLSRVLGSLPELPEGARGFQKTTASWDVRTPEGLVPVYKGQRLVEFRSPLDLVLRALGVDLSRSRYAGELDGYLVKQREEIVGYRQEYMAALAANNHPKAARIKQEFERRIKTPDGQSIPLTVNSRQWQAFLHSRETPRSERILDRIPPEVRPAYAALLSGREGRLGGGEIGVGTSRQRDRAPAMTPSQMEAIQRAMRESEIPGATKERGFGRFSSF